jgi:uncharacterized protein DUF6221
VTDDLVAFLKAQLDAEEQAAKAATHGPWFWADQDTSDFPQGDRELLADEGEWRVCDYVCTWSGEDNLHRGQPGQPGHEHRVTSAVVGAWGYDASGITVADADAAHIARWDPARVLAEVQAKRLIIERCEQYARWAANDDAPGFQALEAAGDHMLRLLALPYASCDGYRAEWAPDTEVNRG